MTQSTTLFLAILSFTFIGTGTRVFLVLTVKAKRQMLGGLSRRPQKSPPSPSQQPYPSLQVVLGLLGLLGWRRKRMAAA